MAFNAMPNPQVLARAPIPISLNSTTFRIAVKDAAATVPEASPGVGGAGTAGPIPHRVFYQYKNLGISRA